MSAVLRAKDKYLKMLEITHTEDLDVIVPLHLLIARS